MPGRQSYTDSPAEGGGGGEEGCSTLPGLWPEACGLALSGFSPAALKWHLEKVSVCPQAVVG